VNELVKETGLNQSNISQHLQVMREKVFVRTEKKRSYVFYILLNPKISKAVNIMKEIFKDQLAEKEKLYKTMKK
jgi:ArsR family transcriptional regulator